MLVDMQFLSDIWVRCESCGGKRFNEETLKVTYRGLTIGDVLQLEAQRALELFEYHPKVRPALEILCKSGLEYVHLGQATNTLSGGELQRLKLAKELERSPKHRSRSVFLSNDRDDQALPDLRSQQFSCLALETLTAQASDAIICTVHQVCENPDFSRKMSCVECH